ncbi:MAG: 3-hydroxybutyryl-CoA dehydratase [Solirubrobacteraceae bacterium]|jgi:acyl dehydratase|nr:3-hydroxybutyryl-CoA dehydratase [Solirubrobacteraceae bacterium]
MRTGDRFTTRGRTVTEADVVAFAGLTGDYHPQHVDAEWAAGSIFGERVAHGLLILGLAAGLVAFDPEEVIALRGVRNAVFKRPVSLGDTIRVDGEVGDVSEAGIASVSLRVRCGERLVARAVLDVVLAAAPAAAENGVSSSSRRELLLSDDVSICVPL